MAACKIAVLVALCACVAGAARGVVRVLSQRVEPDLACMHATCHIYMVLNQCIEHPHPLTQ